MEERNTYEIGEKYKNCLLKIDSSNGKNVSGLKRKCQDLFSLLVLSKKLDNLREDKEHVN